MGKSRHTDVELLELAREGSAPAFAALLHRHREVLRRAALRAERPEQVLETTMLAATRGLRRGAAPAEDFRTWLGTIIESHVARSPGRPDVERMLPADWFDRTWVRAERSWPSGRRRPRPPRWVGQLAAAVLLATAGAGATYLTVTADATTEVIREIIAEPIEDPDIVVVPGPVVNAPPEEAPELFGDVEIGELPTYDLTGEGARQPAPGPTLAPPGGDDRSAGDDDAGDGSGDENAEEPPTD